MLKIIDKKRGFSTVGLMAAIVIIICLITTAAVGYTRLKIRANEAYAVSMLMKLASAFETYRAMNNTYPPSIAALNTTNPPLIDEKLANVGERQGYNFIISSDHLPSTNKFSIIALPQSEKLTGIMYYMINQSGTIYSSNNVTFDADTGIVQGPGWVPLGNYCPPEDFDCQVNRTLVD